ncbi:MAG: hypothetical protein JWQ96_3140 [Segetibacter sp.]|nr:hypothetical protein [Segetibacter sp.]
MCCRLIKANYSHLPFFDLTQRVAADSLTLIVVRQKMQLKNTVQVSDTTMLPRLLMPVTKKKLQRQLKSAHQPATGHL